MNSLPRRLSELVSFPLWGFVAGQQNNLPSPMIPDQGLFDSSNVYISEGRILPRPPLVEHSATGSNTPCSHVAFYISDGGTIRLLRTALNTGTNRVEVFSWDGAAWTSILSASAATASSEDTPPASCMFKGEWLLCPGNGELHRWTGAGAMATIDSLQADTDLQPPNAPRHIAAALGRVFLANGVDPISGNRVPYRVWWCTKSDTTIWDHGSRKPEARNASMQDLAHDNTPVTAMHFHDGKEILAFKPRAVYPGIFNGGANLYQFEPISVDIGCTAGRTIKSYRGLCIFKGDGNVFAKPTGAKPIPIGDAIASRLRAINGDYEHRSSAVLDPILGLYYLFVPMNNDTTCSHMFICSLNNKFAWTEGEIADTDIKAMAATEYYASQAGDTRLLIGSRDGKVYELDYSTLTMTDGDTSYSAYFWSKTFDFLGLMAKMGAETAGIQKLSVQGQSGVANGRVRVGPTVATVEGATATDFGEFDMGEDWSQSSLAAKPNAFRFAQLGAYWAAGETEPMAVDGITAWGMPRGDARE